MSPSPVQSVWITGAGGLIGHSLVQVASRVAPDWEVTGWCRAQLDLTDFAAVRRCFHARPPQMVLHCAAISRSPECQANPALARRINVEATAVLAELAADIPFLFFSSDLVFDGRQGHYTETEPVNPLSVYAETKVAAEAVVLANPGHTVVRTSINGGTSPGGQRAFNEEMRLAWQAGRTLTLFVDEYRSPIPAVGTAQAVWELMRAGGKGLYHVAGRERLSRWQMGELIAARWSALQPRLQRGSLRHYTGAPRSPDTSLDCAKAQALISFPLPGLGEWLQAHPDEVF
jgi:dTDP-4-dehydrorhamnose reductase